MEQCHELVGSPPLGPGEVLSRLRKTFMQLDVNQQLGQYRAEYVIQRLVKSAAAQTLREWEARASQVLQICIFDGDPPIEILDLTVTPFWVHVFHDPEHVESARCCAHVLQCGMTQVDLSEADERQSDGETRHWQDVEKTRRNMERLHSHFEGAEAIFMSESKVSRVLVHHLEINDRRFKALVTLLPTPGLWNELRMRGVLWKWDEFSCDRDCWVRGPYIVEKFYFGKQVEAAIAYCETLGDKTYVRGRRNEITSVMARHRVENL